MSKVIRYFPPLEEWIYLKIYINPIASNFVIDNYIRPIVDSIYPSISDKWFFIRYFDIGYHIRLRFHFSNKRKLMSALKIIHNYLKQAVLNGYIHSWNIDGYERELERYGAENILLTENLFCLNSNLVLHTLEYLHNSIFITNCFAIWTIHDILSRFIQDNNNRAEFCRNVMLSYLHELNLSEDSFISMNKSFRNYRSFLNTLDTSIKTFSSFSKEISYLQNDYFEAMNKIIRSSNCIKNQTINYASLIHLNTNRIYQTEARKIEMVLYYLLYKKYHSDSFKKELQRN
ncbi:MAG: thiopeptide-type bacteriocin biosynthesis protein [Muribaculaceae bacterium]|nr:thiopeptide-type bacteriocin biosynthesis protein [Muribaculaceae bacterium]